MNSAILKKLNYMKNNRIIIAVIFILISFQNVSSQEVYDLGRCVLTGLERNFSLQVSRKREQILNNNFTKGNAGFLPSITTSNRYGGNMATTTQALREGGENVNKGIYNTSGMANVNLDMAIFRGFNVQSTYQKLNELKQVGELSTQMNVENLVSRIISEYYLHIQQLNLYKNLAYAVELSRERVRIDKQRYLLGSSSKLELLQSMVYLNADSSRFAKQDEVLKASQMRLKTLMSVENLEENIVLSDTSFQINAGLIYDELLKLTLQMNTSLLIASKNQVISEIDYKIIASRSYPYLNFTTGYSLGYSGYETGAYDNQKTRGMNYGLTLGLDIFDGFTRRLEKTNAKIGIETQKIQYQEMEQEIKADLITIFYAYENNLKLLNLEEQNLGVARENLGIALERYKLGNLSGLELREVQKSLLDAEERLISVQYLTKLAEISLLKISGQIMEYV
ncbi:MAG: outer membrane protein [Prolixibacteraceae bacterium]|nr:MAG: outer membrane protein [Prolixibacteraceae bacterium]